jgi:hypothetical protein
MNITEILNLTANHPILNETIIIVASLCFISKALKLIASNLYSKNCRKFMRDVFKAKNTIQQFLNSARIYSLYNTFPRAQKTIDIIDMTFSYIMGLVFIICSSVFFYFYVFFPKNLHIERPISIFIYALGIAIFSMFSFYHANKTYMHIKNSTC